jgi:transketolase
MDNKDIEILLQTALRVREHIIKMAGKGGCFIGASLSCTDIVVYLYKKFLNLNINNLSDDSRDYLFLSKGHDVPALYGMFVELGWLEETRLANHCSTTDDIYWHPNTKMPGIEFHSGSLGHLLSVAAGVAMDCKMKKSNNKIVVMLGDGELNEGSSWEGILVASAYKLDNLILIVDRNQFQANIETEKLIPLEPLERKFESFSCYVKTIDGHNFTEIHEVLQSIPFEKNRISVLIADTIRGKGLPSIEKRADRWFCNFNKEEVDSLIGELYGRNEAEITSEKLLVR